MWLERTLIALGILGGGWPVLAQDWKGLGRMEGRVTDASGAPLEGVTVTLELPERGGGTTLRTDSKGRWAIAGLAAGAWHIDFAGPGLVTSRTRVELPTEATRLAPLKVVLQRAAPEGPCPELVADLERADESYRAGRFAEARRGYEGLLAGCPGLAAKIHRQIGFTHVQQEHYAEALRHLRLALDAEPADAEVRVLAAQAALEVGMLDEGRALLAGLDDGAVRSADHFFNLGLGFLNAGAAQEAIGYFSRALALDPGHVDACYRRALAHLQLGSRAEARGDFEKVLELAPESAMAGMARQALAQLR
jgi:tetratricopeptide (TPR) repeat protein